MIIYEEKNCVEPFVVLCRVESLLRIYQLTRNFTYRLQIE